MPDPAANDAALTAYLAQGRVALCKIITFLGGPCGPDDTLAQLFSQYGTLSQRLGGFEAVGVALGLPQGSAKQAVMECNASLRKACAIEAGGADPAPALRLLRLLNQLEQLAENKPEIGVAIRLPEPDNAKLVRGQQQVRALELVIRSLIGEAYGGEARLTEELTAWFGSERVEQWRRAADPGDLLSGTSFHDLAQLFVNETQYPQRYAPLYVQTPYLRMLSDQRKTLATFLDDIRVIRNRFAHHKHVTAVQIALLDRYYDEVITPVQNAHDDERSGVNPDSYFDATSAQLADYFGKVNERLDRIGDDLAVVRDGTAAANVKLDRVGEQVGALDKWTGWAGRHLRLVIGGVAVLGALAVLTLYLTAQTSGEVRGSKKEVSANPRKELANRGVAWRDDDLRRAIDGGDLETAGLFMEGGMKWRAYYLMKILDGHHHDMVALMLDHPDNLLPDHADCNSVMILLPAHDRAAGGGSTHVDTPHQLTADEKRLLKLACAAPEDLALARDNADQAAASYQSQRAEYNKQKAAVQPVGQCVAELSANNYREVIEQTSAFNPMRMRSNSPRDQLYADLYPALATGQLARTAVAKAVGAYCTTQATAEPNIDVDASASLKTKQIYDTLR